MESVHVDAWDSSQWSTTLKGNPAIIERERKGKSITVCALMCHLHLCALEMCVIIIRMRPGLGARHSKQAQKRVGKFSVLPASHTLALLTHSLAPFFALSLTVCTSIYYNERKPEERRKKISELREHKRVFYSCTHKQQRGNIGPVPCVSVCVSPAYACFETFFFRCRVMKNFPTIFCTENLFRNFLKQEVINKVYYN